MGLKNRVSDGFMVEKMKGTRNCNKAQVTC